jgi:predicted Rossmann fold flavoprotein
MIRCMKPVLYDVVVIGGGPAGMMAAGRAAELGARVLLLEKNESLGKKLRITGGGRCNMTNAEFDVRVLLKKYKAAEQFLYSPFSQFGVEDTLSFFHTRGLQTKVENENRVFPITDSAESVWEVLIKYIEKGQVTVRSHSTVKEVSAENGKITGLVLANQQRITAHSYILATGGLSHQETGSTGDGFRMAQELGHKIESPDVSLVPIVIRDKWIRALSGVSLDEVRVSIVQNKKVLQKKNGRVLITHLGLSGPTILNMSSAVRDALRYDKVYIVLNLFPNENIGSLDKKITELIHSSPNKLFRNMLGDILLTRVAEVLCEKVQIPLDIECHSVTKEMRRKVVELLLGIELEVLGLQGADKAIVSSGGVQLSEVDTKTMKSKRIENLYIVGDMLHVDRPSGGYSLQLCWTTGFVAGTDAAIHRASKA